jgi:hypothetical protein
MEEFLLEVVLGAAWYQNRYRGARRKVLGYIALNCLLVVIVPIGIIALGFLAKFLQLQTGAVAGQITGVLTGILALQKTLSTWYASQQRYAAWYKSASDLKTIYFAFIQTWSGKTATNEVAFELALANGSSAARQIISAEQLDYYQKLALPSFDILDMLTSTRSTVSTFVTSLLPGTTATTGSAIGRNVLAIAPQGAPPPSPGGLSHPIPANDFVVVPGGRRHRSHVHRVQSGKQFGFRQRSANRLRQRNTPGPPDAANWITSAGWSNNTGAPISSFVTTWSVPPEPETKASQLLYLFNGIEPADGQLILQPVLQWGDSGADDDGLNRSGPFWTAASWLVGGPDDSATHTPHVRVNPGDTLIGRITLVSQSAAGFVYTCQFDGLPGTTLTTPPIAELVWCVETLEAYELQGVHTAPYDLNAVSEYPSSSIAFTAINIVTNVAGPIGSWQAEDTVSNYGEYTSIANNASTNGEVDVII